MARPTCRCARNPTLRSSPSRGERDDICGIGQTLAAQELCSGHAYMKRHHLGIGVGHYGVFAGRRWSSYIYPILRNVIYASD